MLSNIETTGASKPEGELSLQDRITALLSRECRVGGGTRVTNCVAHMGKPLTERPSDCSLCSTDVQNHLSRCIAVNSWLNEWMGEAMRILEAVALTSVQSPATPLGGPTSDAQGGQSS